MDSKTKTKASLSVKMNLIHIEPKGFFLHEITIEGNTRSDIVERYLTASLSSSIVLAQFRISYDTSPGINTANATRRTDNAIP